MRPDPVSAHPSDRVMIDHFRARRAAFEAYAAYHVGWITAWIDSGAWLRFPETTDRERAD